MPDHFFVLGSAAVGALAREVFRWRALYLHGRIQKYTNPLYVCIAGSIIILASITALIVAAMLPFGPTRYLIAFVVGAGFELVVQAAAKLQMPNIPMGSSEEQRELPASLHEFLAA
jgi:hypothetical protein